ncbi:hypothetical protein ACFLS1_07395 [Verrucomicrobiota bacterium]
MNLDINQHETYITAPDDLSKIVREAIPSPAQPKVVIPGPTDHVNGILPDGKRTAAHRGKLYGMSLAWRGLRFLGFTFGIAAVWFVGAWVCHGRMPLCLSQPRIRFSIGSPPSPILPPTWLVAILGLMVFISICMMLFGTQDITPKIKFKEDQ